MNIFHISISICAFPLWTCCSTYIALLLVLSSLHGLDFCHYWYMNRNFTVALSSSVLILPFCYSKRIDFLKYVRWVIYNSPFRNKHRRSICSCLVMTIQDNHNIRIAFQHIVKSMTLGKCSRIRRNWNWIDQLRVSTSADLVVRNINSINRNRVHLLEAGKDGLEINTKNKLCRRYLEKEKCALYLGKYAKWKSKRLF